VHLLVLLSESKYPFTMHGMQRFKYIIHYSIELKLCSSDGSAYYLKNKSNIGSIFTKVGDIYHKLLKL